MFTARDHAARRETAAGIHLPYLAQIDDHTVVTREGHLLHVIALTGLPFETIGRAELESRLAVRDAMFQAIGTSRFALCHHVVRREVAARIEGEFGDGFSAELDESWNTLLASRRLYVNDLYLTLSFARSAAGRGGPNGYWVCSPALPDRQATAMPVTGAYSGRPANS